MRYKILLYGLIAAVVSSCSSAYKATQTPDDVYYSPARANTQKQTAKRDQRDRYEDYVASEDDQYLRMKIRDRQRWSGIDDYSYWNDSRYVPSYNYNYDYYRNSRYNAYAWNNWNISPYSSFYFNPYYAGGFGGSYLGSGYFNPHYGFGYNPYRPVYITKNPTRMGSTSVNRPSLNSYRNGLYNNNNRNYNNNNNQGFGNTMKRVFSPNENSSGYNNRNTNTNTYSAPERSYTPSSSSGRSSSSGSSGGNSGGVSRPPR